MIPATRMAPAQEKEMFNNLIESSSHAGEFKRRGSFLLFTTVTYLLLFAIAGVMSIYAYDAQLEEPASEITMLSPMDLEVSKPPVSRDSVPAKSKPSKQNVVEREVAMTSVKRPDVMPETVSATPSKNIPIPDRGSYEVTGRNRDPEVVGGPGPVTDGTGRNAGSTTPVIDVGTPPPAPEVKKTVPRVISRSVILNGDALFLPKPPYPPLAKQMGIQGRVSVQVLIDESGKVISARAVSGSAALVTAAQRAAFEARFSPTRLNDQPVKVSGIITYNFVLQ